jgi:hypothetical protein
MSEDNEKYNVDITEMCQFAYNEVFATEIVQANFPFPLDDTIEQSSEINARDSWANENVIYVSPRVVDLKTEKLCNTTMIEFCKEYIYNDDVHEFKIQNNMGGITKTFKCIDHINCTVSYHISLEKESQLYIVKKKGFHSSSTFVKPSRGYHKVVKQYLQQFVDADFKPRSILRLLMCCKNEKIKMLGPTKIKQVISIVRSMKKTSIRLLPIKNKQDLNSFVSLNYVKIEEMNDNSWNQIKIDQLVVLQTIISEDLQNDTNRETLGFVFSCKGVLDNITKCQRSQYKYGMTCFVDGTYK